MPDSPFDLLLRPWSESDAAGVRDAIDENVGHIRPWLSWSLEEPAPLEQTRARLRTWVEQYRTGTTRRYAITLFDEPARILGGAHVGARVGPRAVDIGYWVRASAVRQGIATSVASALAVRAFAGRDIDRLVIRCDIANTVSASVARALGFDSIGEATTSYPDGTARPLLLFAMDRVEWEARHAPAFRDRARRVRIVDEQQAGPQ